MSYRLVLFISIALQLLLVPSLSALLLLHDLAPEPPGAPLRWAMADPSPEPAVAGGEPLLGVVHVRRSELDHGLIELGRSWWKDPSAPGMRLVGVREGELFHALGLRNGDVVRRVEGAASEANIVELVVERDGAAGRLMVFVEGGRLASR